ncbi:Sulfatase-modifying factor enzyme 1 [Jannaschia faecimaris]|uniref:Sulfatase-modifying factor enzyme 1 n=1 Tax=Jannaschia faecimaris TaxID=1244108 RepID=A0A1H3T2T8_9RHOB|nr:formylglycine-generating enzyme family protein [Jannaschia faecimaris]SDZ44055.1 Sulfatase-modifying factor enzyme 1 [Jannaschia faecimaris]
MIGAAAVAAITTDAAAQIYSLPDGRVVTPLETFRECDVCPEMVALPQEPFTMGTQPWESVLVSLRRMPSGERRGNDFEGPVHRVEMDLILAMGRNEITYDEWMACVEADGCDHTPPTEIDYADSPVDVSGRPPVLNVSYIDILEYAAWLNARVGAQVYRLPTEAEWEFAARAGTTTPFAQGDRLTPAQAAYSGRPRHAPRTAPSRLGTAQALANARSPLTHSTRRTVGACVTCRATLPSRPCPAGPTAIWCCPRRRPTLPMPVPRGPAAAS